MAARVAGSWCYARWIPARLRFTSSTPFRRFANRDAAPDILCIDVPIGLLDQAVPGGRGCDKAARVLLGQPRGRSVFSPPARPTLRARRFEEALRLNRATSPHALGISRQSFGILPKIREVDELITPGLQDRILEVHPELVFYELNDAKPLVESKKSRKGRNLRTRWDGLENAMCRNLSRLKGIQRLGETTSLTPWLLAGRRSVF